MAGTPRPDAKDTSAAERLLRRVEVELEALLLQPLAATLYVIATPIGHLGDVTLRALAVLARADIIYCEDTRHSQKLMERYGIGRPLRAYHEHNAEKERPHILAAVAAGKAVALISDAGTPLISDPGYKLVRDVIEAGHGVISLPGPSALLAGLTSSGLPTDCFVFAGFLPPKEAARRARIAELASAPGTLVLFEAPGRVARTLADLRDGLGPREAAVARELTKVHEELRRGSLADLARQAAEGAEARGEFVILVGPAAARSVTDDEIAAALDSALVTSSLRDAVRDVTARLGAGKSRVYEIAVRLKGKHGATDQETGGDA